jgi:ABC-2 type transport system ATP-binding protein
MISVENLTRRFGRFTAVDNVSFHVNRGEIVGFLGPNGAGKTTTMRVLSCFLTPTGGTVTVAGLDVLADSIEVRRRVGYLPESVPLYDDMRVGEYLAYRGRLKGLGGSRLRERVDDSVVQCDINDVFHKPIGTLSKGYKQRVGLADSLLHEPDVLILDEPTMGLDPNQIRRTRNLIRSLGRRHTVLLSSHILHEVESVCERVLIINQGRIVASDTTENLVALIKGHVVTVSEISGPYEEVVRRVQAIPGVTRVRHDLEAGWTKMRIESVRGRDVRTDLFHLASLNGWTLRELREERRNLEDVFVAVTDGSDGAEQPAAGVQEGA